MTSAEDARRADQATAQPRKTAPSAVRIALLAVLIASAATIAGYVWWPMQHGDPEPAVAVAGGDIERGRDALRAYGCIACHRVPGVPSTGGDAWVGPPLDSWSQRVYIAGSLTNDPDNLIQWIQYPDAIEPGTAMPTLAVSDEDARDIAAYLFSLK